MSSRDRVILGSSENRDLWLEQRSRLITASDVGTVLRANPYKTPYKLFVEKTRKIVTPDNNHMRRGRKMEPKVLEAFASWYGCKYRPWNTLIASRRYPWLGATIDGVAVIEGVACVLEAKAPARSWESEPEMYWIQVITQMLVTGMEAGFLIEGIGPDYSEMNCRRIDLADEADMVGRILTETKAFHDCVMSGILHETFW